MQRMPKTIGKKIRKKIFIDNDFGLLFFHFCYLIYEAHYGELIVIYSLSLSDSLVGDHTLI